MCWHSSVSFVELRSEYLLFLYIIPKYLHLYVVQTNPDSVQVYNIVSFVELRIQTNPDSVQVFQQNRSTTVTAVLSELEGLPIRFLLETKSRPLRSSRYTIMGREFKRVDKLVAHFAENAESSELQHPYAYFYFSSRMCCSPHDCFTFSDSDYYSQDGTLSVVMAVSDMWM